MMFRPVSLKLSATPKLAQPTVFFARSFSNVSQPKNKLSITPKQTFGSFSAPRFTNFAPQTPKTPITRRSLHSSILSLFKKQDLAASNQKQLVQMADELGLEHNGLSKGEMVKMLTPYADDAPKSIENDEDSEEPFSEAAAKFWADIKTKLDKAPEVSTGKLSLDSFDELDEVATLQTLKAMFKDLSVSPADVVIEMELLDRLASDETFNPENLPDEEELIEYRKGMLLTLRKEIGTEVTTEQLNEALTKYFSSPYADKTEEGNWLKSQAIELLLTTILDSKPAFETDNDWDENLFLTKLNGALESLKLKFSYDTEYDWEDTTGQPLEVTLSDLDGKKIGSIQYKFPDADEFDQQDLMQPINDLLAKKGVKFMDASLFTEEDAAYNWVLLSVDDAKKVETRYGPFTEWYQHFPERDWGEGEEGEYMDEEPEEVVPKQKSIKGRRQEEEEIEEAEYVPKKSHKK